MKKKILRKEIDSNYKLAQQLAKEIWLGENETEDAGSFYYFQCGFIAGMNFQKKEPNNDDDSITSWI